MKEIQAQVWGIRDNRLKIVHEYVKKFDMNPT